MTRDFGHPSGRHFLLRVVAPLFGAAIIVNLVAAGLLFWSTSEADRISIERQSVLADRVVSQLRARVALDQESVTVWDDAIEGVQANNQDWLDVNLGSWMHTYFGHDAAYVIDPANQPIFASIEGVAAEPGSIEEFWHHTSPLVEDLRRRLRAGDDTGVSDRVLSIGASDIAAVAGRPAVISVKPITSDSGEIEQVPGEEFLHIAVRYLDQSLVEELEQSYLLDGLRFSWTDAHARHETASALQNSTGTALGYYVWSPFRPGAAVFSFVWPILLGLFIAGMGALAVLLVVLRRHSLSLTRSQAQMKHLAAHDTLTGLPNRSQFDVQLEDALASTSGDECCMALLYLDLDRFKEVNDTLGHAAGDQVLCEFADRLRGVTRHGDTVARLGGDEFTIILKDIADESAILQCCERIVESARHPFDLDETRVFIGVSIGVAVSSRDGVTAADLTRKADMALYSAKARGRSCYALFSPDMERLIAERRELERDLRRAIEAPDQFEVHYQALFGTKQRNIVGVEALARWNHPSRGPVAPEVFIPLAEEAGLIERLGELVLRRACAAAGNWPIETLAVNVSAIELQNPAFAVRVANTLMATGFNPHRLELEVTETAMSDKEGNSQRNIAALRDIGVRFALDDFGIGFSSLGRLQQLDVDRIKIDRSFVNGFGTNNGDEAIVRAIVELAKATGLKTTAEGVETLEQDELLGAIGCDELQGFLLARPLPAAELGVLFAANRSPAERRAGG